MGTLDHRSTVETLLARLGRGEIAVMDEVFHEDAIIDWPQFSERIRGAENRRRVYERIPRLPRIAPRRIVGAGDLWVAEATLDYGDGGSFSAVLVFEFRGERIARETAYWATPGPPAAWRAAWTEPLDERRLGL